MGDPTSQHDGRGEAAQRPGRRTRRPGQTDRGHVVPHRLRTMVCQLTNSPVGIALLTADLPALLRVGGPVGALDWVWAVRRDWRDGTHEFIRPRRAEERARRALAGDAAFWRRGPVRPRLSLVQLPLAEFRAHAGGHACRSTTCPVQPASAAAVVR